MRWEVWCDGELFFNSISSREKMANPSGLLPSKGSLVLQLLLLLLWLLLVMLWLLLTRVLALELYQVWPRAFGTRLSSQESTSSLTSILLLLRLLGSWRLEGADVTAVGGGLMGEFVVRKVGEGEEVVELQQLWSNL